MITWIEICSLWVIVITRVASIIPKFSSTIKIAWFICALFCVIRVIWVIGAIICKPDFNKTHNGYMLIYISTTNIFFFYVA